MYFVAGIDDPAEPYLPGQAEDQGFRLLEIQGLKGFQEFMGPVQKRPYRAIAALSKFTWWRKVLRISLLRNHRGTPPVDNL